MLYPENVGEKLGFNDIKELLRNECLSLMGKNLVDKMQFITNFELLNKLLSQTAEFKEILMNDAPFPSANFIDIQYLVNKIRIEGAFLSEEDFYSLTLALTTVFQTIRYFKDREEQYPNLQALFEGMAIEQKILKSIDAVIDPKGKIRPNASPELNKVIREIAAAESESRRRLDIIFRNAIKEGWSADGSLTIRDGRLVIPVLAEHKRKMKGFIHDESATGQTIYLEPAEVFDLNNRVRDLEFEKRREIIRILTALTDEVRPYSPLLIAYHGLLTKIDFIRAKASLAIKLDASMPILKNEPYLKLSNARHPLLYLNFKQTKQTVVPLNIKIDETGRIILVSGPNAGGKSVCMKTVGLLQLMLQAGMLIPADSHSEMGLYRRILVDIGDDQSIESDLSTYSAHLTKMKNFVEMANFHTLVMIDEFGTGTDPQFGGPIAEAVLQVLNQKKVKGVLTTHYSNLKLFANNTEGLENASMLFDNVHMQPMYVLQIGKPGSSYAFEIAQKIGLPEQVLKLAKVKIGDQQKKVDTLLVDLEREKKQVYDTKVEIEKRQKRLNELLEENKKLKEYFDENRKKLVNDAKQQAQDIIKGANKLVENTIAEIRTAKADKEQTKQARQRLEQEQQKLKLKADKPVRKKEAEPLAVGDWVKLIDSDTTGKIIELNKTNAVIAIGELMSVVKVNRLEKIQSKDQPVKQSKGGYADYQIQQRASFSPEIDVRGMRGEEMLYELEKFMDRALMMGLSSLRILHGRGDGILRKLIRDYLKKYSAVDQMEDEHPDRGGDGITIVKLK
ncbi:endonuclease MutS2 [Solitalea canadensis]|uniref:Endonuclease MutS2 n=1 Tax=Solitalea canadensis (strain ATCC 29591 / DSM 3403 / JCM 21819 / LMG 8368 / NBRC 15130 / NCIMB 12057 / USAM 9D) TaxID=929556 RepID=H8KW58_SOLCM|nr:endonuclease MutS2 [Solitalea canadensis]AFD07079.1 MutS2 family protein [Solitalea canadensis DSM 3403]